MAIPVQDLQPDRNAEPKAPVKDPTPKKNATQNWANTGGVPIKASNGILMRGIGDPEYYAAGQITYPAHKLAEVVTLRAMANFWEKQAQQLPAPQPQPTIVPAANKYDQVAQNLVGQWKSKLQPPAPAQMPTVPGQSAGLPKLGSGIPGGLADGQPDTKYPPKELAAGKQVEKEHTEDPDKAKDIAKDHLEEHDKYYTALEEMERKLESSEDEEQEKLADVPRFMKQQQFLLLTPEGKVVIKPGQNRRLELPSAGQGKPVPYEGNIVLAPPEGIPEAGFHGYDIRLHEGEAPTVPEGFEARDPMEALKEMYASMGMTANRPYRELDRARARALIRMLKRRAKAQSSAVPAVA